MAELATSDDPKYITIGIVGSDIHENVYNLYFPVKFDAPLGDLKKKYANATATNVSFHKFFHLQHLIKDEDTPKSLALKEMSIIAALQVSTAKLVNTGTVEKAASSGDDEYVNLKVVDNFNEMQYQVRMNAPLLKLKNDYAERKGLSVDFVRFMFNKREVLDDQTPKSLGMVDYDAVDVFQDE